MSNDQRQTDAIIILDIKVDAASFYDEIARSLKQHPRPFKEYTNTPSQQSKFVSPLLGPWWRLFHDGGSREDEPCRATTPHEVNATETSHDAH